MTLALTHGLSPREVAGVSEEWWIESGMARRAYAEMVRQHNASVKESKKSG